MATLKAVAPVAQALETLNTGIPVCPICFCNCWPIPAPAFIRFPTPSTPTSEREIPASFSAIRLASAARSTTSLSGCLPNLVILDPIIQIVSDPIFLPIYIGSKPKAIASVPSLSFPIEYVISLTCIPRVTYSGDGSTFMIVHLTLVPAQSTTADTYGIGPI